MFRRILFAGVFVGIGWLVSGVGNFSLNTSNYIQERLVDLQIALGAR
jgi:hypothetical protein